VILNTGRVAFSGSAASVRDDQNLITQHLGVF
jgi:ABC-type branched-subunit amino acid transport system ATPase component